MFGVIRKKLQINIWCLSKDGCHSKCYCVLFAKINSSSPDKLFMNTLPFKLVQHA
jgi:hypothetical protein